MSATRDPETDQPLPVPTIGPSMHDLAVERLRERKALGLAKYGSLLQAGNGRDSLEDACQEAADLLVYLEQARLEVAGLRAELAAERARAEWAEKMMQAAWAIVRAYETSGSPRPEKIEAALEEIDRVRRLLAGGEGEAGE